MSEIELINLARTHGSSVAIRTDSAEHTYEELLLRSEQVALHLLDDDGDDLREARVAYLIPAGFDYIVAQWGIWSAGGIAVPLSLSATESELEYTLTDSQAGYVVVTRELARKLIGLCNRLVIPLLVVDEISAQLSAKSLPAIKANRRAMILYTSGTTSKPKGVISTHANIQAQIETLVAAWAWHTADCIPLFLPLHHIHGIINVMSCSLWAGATIEPFSQFEMRTILRRVADGAYTVFMAVPTIYVKLIQELKSLSGADREPIIAGFNGMRLMISGSAALPANVHEEWTSMTGQKLLERYGMTEIGMGLSNPYDGERRPGTVGQPLPGVQVRLKTENGEVVTNEGEPGEIQVRSPSVFLGYWNRPQVTAVSFDDGWFCTGDMAIVEDNYYRIMGRQSVDIIKSGGYKLSALEIEAALLDHPAIRECAVVGITDEMWGEKVAVAAVLESGCELDLGTLRTWCAKRLSKYKIPKKFLQVDSLPRNTMGKVTKPAVRNFF